MKLLIDFYTPEYIFIQSKDDVDALNAQHNEGYEYYMLNIKTDELFGFFSAHHLAFAWEV